MSAEFLLKVATVLEQAATVIDTHESEKAAAVKLAREVAFKSMADKFMEATGEELPAEVAEKLASSDEDVITTVKQLLDKTAGSVGTVESLGRSSEKSASKQPTNKREAAQAAWDRFGEYCINS